MSDHKLTDLQKDVLALIRERTKNKPITGAEISRRVRLRERIRMEGQEEKMLGANLRSVVHALRKKGYPVCANKNGYYMPSSPSELKEYLDSFRARIESQKEALYGIHRCYALWIENVYKVVKNKKQ